MEKDLSYKEGIDHIRNVIGNGSVIMLATNLVKTPFSVCPMISQRIDDQGGMWIFSNRNSNHFKDIAHDNRVQILYSDTVAQDYLSLFGNAVHIVDKRMIDDLWEPIDSNWFEGKDDPNLVLININIDQAQYWDFNVNKPVSLIDINRPSRSGSNLEPGNKGHINLENY